jgi:uncharacterized protein (UPF0248 family)
MMPIHKVLDKIKWDKREHIEDYIVGYFDRVENKIIEVKLAEFSDEIPLHRIRYLKKKGEIVWDRRSKFSSETI